MVGVIKSKGPQEQTRGAGVLQINTGADQVASAIGRAADRVGQVAYQQFEVEETKKGKEAARKLKLRDENGNIMFQDITSEMTRVARNAAEPIINERYGRQLSIDMDEALIDLRRDVNAHQNDPEKFRELASVKLEGMMSSVPDEFMDVGQTTLDGVGAERTMDHYNQLTRQKINEEEAAAITNQLLGIQDNVKTIQALIASGDIEEAELLAENSRIEAGRIISMGGNLSQQKAAIRSIDTIFYGQQADMIANEMIAKGEYDLLDAMAESYRGNQIVDPDRQVVVGGQQMTLREALSAKGITDESIRNIDDVEVRDIIAADIRTVANQYSSRQSDNSKLAALRSEMSNQMNGALHAGNGTKTENDMQELFTAVGLDPVTILGPTGVAQSQDPNSSLGKFLRNGQVFPSAMVKAFTNVYSGKATTPDELRNLLTLWGTGSMGITKDGPVVNSKLTNEVNAFWKNVNNYALSYGMEAANEYATSLTKGSTVGEDLQNEARRRLGNPNKDAYAQIKDRIIEEELIDDMNPSAIRRLETIAIRAYSSLPPEEADEYLQTAYETIYAPTKLIMTPNIMGAKMVKRSEFAPERFYPNGEIYDQFEQMANKKIRTANPSLTLGDNAFLYPAPDSTNSSVTWQVLDKNGQSITNSNGPIYIKSQMINQNKTLAAKFGQAMQSKIDAARELRTREMEISNIVDNQTPPSIADIRREVRRRKNQE